jgi:D-tagatose-1,6-bisphosphate aldolase subunit GatZ/KbaZ
VCSAHPVVIQAALRHARENDAVALIEATSNQVDQFGGYTGMVPAQFRDLVHATARQIDLPADRVVLGGDHLGPNTWRGLPAAEAMTRAADLVAAYVDAGYTKIHLDTSMACADDPGSPADDVVAQRAAQLAAVAERIAAERFGRSNLVYVVGTEVPIPGGARETIGDLAPTTADAARGTLATHHNEFARAGVEQAWERVIALVVQPGVEFDAWRVVDYDRAKTSELRRIPAEFPPIVFEAHSTDYQRRDLLAELVGDHWAILKVGPALTFALREALFALASIEDECVPAARRSQLVDRLERVMLARPRWWQGHYHGDPDEQRLARRYSYSDRVRYYWPEPDVAAAQDELIENLRRVSVPLPLISAFLPRQYARIRAGEVEPDPVAIAIDHVRDVLREYPSGRES